MMKTTITSVEIEIHLRKAAISRALNQISRSPFMHKIEERMLPQRFTQPTFTVYNGRTDLMEHVSHFNERMDALSTNEALMCKVFPSNLGPMAMRWFDGLAADSINSFRELTRAFGSRFITCSRVLQPLDSLLFYVHARRGNPENILRQILGDVQ